LFADIPELHYDNALGLDPPPLAVDRLGILEILATCASRMLPASSISRNDETIETLSLTLRWLPIPLLMAVSPDKSDAFSAASSVNGFGVSAKGSKVV
jgi:hypothetical protein